MYQRLETQVRRNDPDHLARIAFVTGAYPRMRAAIVAIGFGPVTIWMLRCVRQGDVAQSFVALAALFAVRAALTAPEKWLDRRFGRVRRGFTGAWRDVAPMLFAISLAPLAVLDDWSLGSGGPSVLMLALAVLGLWITVRDWPYRPHALIFCATCAVSSLWLGAVSDRPDLLLWRMRADAAAILAWMAVGLFDLMMLRRLLPGPLRGLEDESPVDAR